LGLVISPKFSFSNSNSLTNTAETIDGIGYYIKIAVLALRRDFEIARVNVEVKFAGESEWREGVIFNAPKHDITFLGEATPRTFIIPSGEHIDCLLAIEKGRPAQVFIPFCVRKNHYEPFRSYEIEIHRLQQPNEHR